MVFQRLPTFIFLLLLFPKACQARFQCSTDDDCVTLLREGSICDLSVNLCTNPYANGGCLYQHATQISSNYTIRKRVCNSQDPPDAASKGYCTPAMFDYTEVRIEIQNWDSATFLTYLMQIVLSELLGVPTSIETSFIESPANFYQPHSILAYGWSDDKRAMNRSSRFGDCVPFTTKPKLPEDESSGIEHEVENEIDYPGYLACAHVISESTAWWTLPFVQQGILEPNHPNGILGRKGWYIPLHTAKHDPSLLHYTGLMGEENREKLAKTFKRPIEFLQYCIDHSPNNCSEPDEVALRYQNPHEVFEKNEQWRYHLEGVYTGYFVETEKNNCTKHPTNCTGHIVDYPCGWGSFVEATTHHLDIALASSGYMGTPNGYLVEQLADIWRAAKATNNHVMMHFQVPHALVSQFSGTDWSFERVTLPQPTQTIEEIPSCAVRKIMKKELETQQAVAMKALKLFSTAFHEITKGNHIHEAFHSPAYDALLAFAVTDLQVMDFYSKILKWNNSDTRQGWGLRETVCEWAVENLDVLEGVLPTDYPRVIEQGNAPLASTITCLVLGVAATGIVVCTTGLIFHFREKTIMRYSQVEFMQILLVGLLFIAMGTIMVGIPRITNAGCVTEIWLIGLGYTLELVPLIVKQAAINRMVQASKRMQRFRVTKTRLFGNVILITLLEIFFLLLWTALDPPSKTPEYKLTDQQDNDGNTIMEVLYYCSSVSKSWALVNTSWNALLLLVATVYALQIRKAFDKAKEARTLAFLIYFQFMLVLFRLATYFLDESMSGFILGQTRSLIYSVDVIGACGIYFAPKIRAATRIRGRSLEPSSSIAVPPAPREYPVPIQRAFKLISNISSIILPGDDPLNDEDEEDPFVQARGGEDNLRVVSTASVNKSSMLEVQQNMDLVSSITTIKEETSDAFQDKDMDDLRALIQEKNERIAILESRLREHESCSLTADGSLTTQDSNSRKTTAEILPSALSESPLDLVHLSQDHHWLPHQGKKCETSPCQRRSRNRPSGQWKAITVRIPLHPTTVCHG